MAEKKKAIAGKPTSKKVVETFKTKTAKNKTADEPLTKANDAKQTSTAMSALSNMLPEKLRRAQEEIEKLARFPEENPNPVYRISKEGVLLYANPAGRRLILEDKTKIGDKIPEKWIGMIKSVYDSGTMQRVEVEFDGRIFLFEQVPVIEGGYVNLYAIDITERKQTEQTLRDSEQRLKAAMDASELGIWDWDLITGEIMWVGHHAKLFGYEDEQFDGRYETFEKRVHPKDLPALRVAIEKSRNEKTEYQHEYRVIWPDGSIHWVLGKGRCKYDDTGRAVRMLGTVQNVTDRKKAEKDLRESHEYLEKLTDSMWDAVFSVKMPERVIEWINDSFRLTGYELEECIGKTTEFLYPDKSEYINFGNKLASAIEAGKDILHTEQLLKRKNGELFPAEITTTVFREEGEVVRVTSIVRDITERKKMEQQLKDAFNLNQIIIDTSPVGIWIFEESGQLVMFNPSGIALSGGTAEQLLKLNFRELESWKKSGLLQVAEEALLTGKLVKKEIHVVNTLNTEVWYEALLSTIKFKGKNHLLLMTYDVKDKKHSEEALRISERDLAEAQKIAHVGSWRWEIIPDEVYWSDEVYRLFGVEPGEPVDYVRYLSIVLPEDRDFVMKEVQDALDGTRPYENEHRIVRNGEIRIHHTKGTVTWDEQGRPIRLFGVAQDITERKKTEKKIIRLNRILETITSINQDMFRTKDRHQLLGRICERIVEYAYRLVWIGFCDERTQRVVPEAQAGFEKGYLDSVKITYDDTGYGKGPTGTAIRTKKPSVMRFIATDPRYGPWRKEALMRGYRSSAAIPIFGADEVIGALNVYADKEDAFGNEEVKLLEELAHDISTGLRGIDEETTRKKADKKIYDYQQQLKALTYELSLIEERAKRKIAAGLHDNISQGLAMAKLELQSLMKVSPDAKMSDSINSICEEITRMIDDVNSLTFELGNPLLDVIGLTAALEKYITEEIQAKFGVECKLIDEAKVTDLEETLRTVLYRSTRELLINAVKHAQAHNIKVRIYQSAGNIHICVEDDGVGFDVGEIASLPTKTGKFGLFSIKEQLEYLGENLQIESGISHGTKVTMTMPLKLQEPTSI